VRLVAFFAVFRAPRFFVVRRFAALRVARFFVVRRFVVLRAARFLVVRLAVLRAPRFFVVRFAAFRFAGLRAAFLRAAAFFLAGLRAAFFLVAFFLAVAFFFFAGFAGFAAGALGSGDGVGSHGRGSGRGGGGGGQVLPPPPWSPESPPLDGGHVGVMGASLPPPARIARYAFPRRLRGTRHNFQCPRALVARNDPAEAGSPSGEIRSPVGLVGSVDQENDCPHPQVRVVFGLLIVNPASCSPSL
jgi:hypothetical protein